jgi:hypothetical protein
LELPRERRIAESQAQVLKNLCILISGRKLLNPEEDLSDLVGGPGNPAARAINPIYHSSEFQGRRILCGSVWDCCSSSAKTVRARSTSTSEKPYDLKLAAVGRYIRRTVVDLLGTLWRSPARTCLVA